MGETVLRTAVACFCPRPCMARVRARAAGLLGWIVLGNASDQGKFGLFTCYKMKSLSEACSQAALMLFTMERSTRTMRMDHFSQT